MDEVAPVPFRTQEGVRQVKRDQVLGAMKEFDLKYRSNEADSGSLYAVEESGRRYPPKRVLELATGVPRSKFYGGNPQHTALERPLGGENHSFSNTENRGNNENRGNVQGNIHPNNEGYAHPNGEGYARPNNEGNAHPNNVSTPHQPQQKESKPKPEKKPKSEEKEHKE